MASKDVELGTMGKGPSRIAQAGAAQTVGRERVVVVFDDMGAPSCSSGTDIAAAGSSKARAAGKKPKVPPKPRAAATKTQDPEWKPASFAPITQSWDDTWRFTDMPQGLRIGLIIALVVVVLVLMIVIPIVFASSQTVAFHRNAVLIKNDGDVDRAVGPGRYFPGPNGEAVRFNRFDSNVEYTRAVGGAVNPRVKDGQIIELDLSFQYGFEERNLLEIYRIHKRGLDGTLRNLARSILRDVAARFESSQFFTNRSAIEAEMRARLTEEAEARLVLLTGFQIRDIHIDEKLDGRLLAVQLAKQDARARQEQLQLDRINADAAALELQLRTERNKFLSEYDQETEVLLATLLQDRRRIEEQTRQLVTEILETQRRNVSLYEQETAILEEEVTLQTSVEVERTRRLVDKINFEAATNLTVFKQGTDNLRLQYEQQVALLEEQTRQNVTRIESNTSRRVELFASQAAFALHDARASAQALLAEVQETAANRTLAARAAGLRELPAAVYYAETIANSTLGSVRFMDTNFSSLVDEAVGA